MKTPQEYEAEIRDLNAMIDKMKRQLTMALEEVAKLQSTKSLTAI